MKDFAEFEPSCWQEDGMVTGRHFHVFKTLGQHTVALFAAVAISLASLGSVFDPSVMVPSHAVASSASPPIEARPFDSGVRPERGDRDVVPAAFWLAADHALRALPQLPPEPPDDEPLI